MAWFVVEVQSNGETGSTIVNSYPTQAEAESKFHSILSFAAVSSVFRHGAIMFSDTMDGLMTRVFEHPAEEPVIEAGEETL